ncbi:MAG: hypothetical protein ACRELF_16515 [Gemmataceae bacterium]
MMRKGCLLLVLALSGPGCLSSGTHVEAESRQMPPLRMAEAPPAVTADQVNEANAASIPQALAREMDYESNGLSPAPTTATPNMNMMKP